LPTCRKLSILDRVELATTGIATDFTARERVNCKMRSPHSYVNSGPATLTLCATIFEYAKVRM